MNRAIVSTLVSMSLGMACSSTAEHASPALQAEVQAFLDGYSTTFQKLYTASYEAEWVSNTHIVEGDDSNARRTRSANEALAAFTGSAANIETARGYLARQAELNSLQRRQLETILF